MNYKAEEDYLKNLGLKIRNLRKEKNATQKTFALSCGIGASEIYMLEFGLTNPKIATIVKIAKGCGLTIDELLKVE